MSKIIAKSVGDKIIIEMPIDTLVYACENCPDYDFMVNNKDDFAKYIVNQILEFDVNSGTGLTAFQTLLDSLFVDMYESGGPIYDQNDLDGCNYE
jgi:hypothetical protein